LLFALSAQSQAERQERTVFCIYVLAVWLGWTTASIGAERRGIQRFQQWQYIGGSAL
jgi:hypothetical protein